MTSAYRNNLEYSRALQEKYEYYLVALNFTLLALSVQTAKFGDCVIASLFEMLGWILLLLSGFVALKRLEMQPVAHKNAALLTDAQAKLMQLEAYKQQGTTQVVYSDREFQLGSIDDAIALRKEAIAKNEPILEVFSEKLTKQYAWHRNLFFAGIIAVVCARAYTPLLSVLYTINP